jgi:orotate phosphoribosyltransferase
MSDHVTQLFKKAGAILDGHFLLSSGLHSPVYWEKFRILQYPHYTVELCSLIADHFKKDNIQVVAGPTIGGIILAYEVARQLGTRGIFAEKEGVKREFRRGFNIDPEERVLIVDDILTTGNSIIEVIAAVNQLKGKIIGIGVLLDRAEQQKGFGVPLFSCLRVPTETYKPQECPLCTAGVPLIRPGSAAK